MFYFAVQQPKFNCGIPKRYKDGTHESTGQSRLISIWPITGHLTAVLACWWTWPGVIGEMGEKIYFVLNISLFATFVTLGIQQLEHRTLVEAAQIKHWRHILFKDQLCTSRTFQIMPLNRETYQISFLCHTSIVWRFKNILKKGSSCTVYIH